MGWFATCTNAAIPTGGTVLATLAEQPWLRSHSLPVSEPKKMAARAHVIPNMVADTPLYGGPKISFIRPTKSAASLKPDCPMAAAFQSGKLTMAAQAEPPKWAAK